MHIDNSRHLGLLTCFAALLLIASIVITAHCDTSSPNGPSGVAAHRTVTRNGYVIELFDSAEDQLRYARAWFSDVKEKQAALEVLIEHYQEAKTARAEAELELAYLALGADYRFADETACLRAIGKYEQITAQFPELPAICAKAHWYIGWIYADLLGQRQRAAAHYQTIVDQYPDTTQELAPPVPWVSLVLPQVEDKPRTVYERPVYSWRSMALLEMIRNTDDEDKKWSAFETLWSADFRGAATGYALRNLLHGSPALAQKAADRARLYLHARLFGRPMAEDIRQALSRANLNQDAWPQTMP